MGDKFRKRRSGTEKYFRKHKGFKDRKPRDRRPDFRDRQPSRYDPDARY